MRLDDAIFLSYISIAAPWVDRYNIWNRVSTGFLQLMDVWQVF